MRKKITKKQKKIKKKNLLLYEGRINSPGITVENVQKGKLNNDKKKVDVNVKKIKKESACCEPDPIKPGSIKSAGNAR